MDISRRKLLGSPFQLYDGQQTGNFLGWIFIFCYRGKTITDYYDYFTPIREYMPQNCSSDIQAVIAYLDGMYAATTQPESGRSRRHLPWVVSIM
ncbi:hypothetical protein BDR07DRAFT_1027150 [Suillus spraguei]|nr:hypothetical protein BDR07DRAFT_1027150 [Suillus spraguei]